MKQITNYPNQDDYETEEEFNEAQELYWMELDRQYDEFKQDKLNELNTPNYGTEKQYLYKNGVIIERKKDK